MRFKVRINIPARQYRQWMVDNNVTYGKVSGTTHNGQDRLAGLRKYGRDSIEQFLIVEIPRDDDAVMFKLVWTDEIISLM